MMNKCETFLYLLKKFPGFVLTAQLKTFCTPQSKIFPSRRGAKDQRQVELLKAKAYEASVTDLMKRYSQPAVAVR